jgi:hypothetical protein
VVAYDCAKSHLLSIVFDLKSIRCPSVLISDLIAACLQHKAQGNF